jgi:hypothetical protein
MAALDTFDWFVQASLTSSEEQMQGFIQEQRTYLRGLRSEDERQRFVEEFMKDIKKLQTPKSGM